MRSSPLLAAAIAAAVFALPAPRARSCSCLPPPPPPRALEQADAVFEGRMFAQAPAGNQQIRFEFEVRRVWKGEVPEKVAVLSHEHSATCGRRYETGVTYLVYARRRDGALHDGLCSRTRTIDKADEDLAALGEGRAPKAGGSDAASGGAPVEEPPRVVPEPAPAGDDARPTPPARVSDEPPPADASPRGCRVGSPRPRPATVLAGLALLGLRRRRR